MNVKKWFAGAVSAALLTAGSVNVNAADYVIDTEGAHAFVQFKISHLGYSWLYGRFNTFEGEFSFDEAKPSASKISVSIDTSSVDSNHAERDKHLRSKDFLEVGKYPKATFVSTRVEDKGDGKALVHGDFTLRGITKPIVIEATHVGGGDDPWGGYRNGFSGKTSFKLKDFGVPKNLGPASEEIEIFLSIEGIRK
ncbi:YceI family protein [Alkalimarinus coralli]|uniref:YceI family protein n=1 Tax=Alkalimarinus coralli TaxID=2935863 RepID=UPI00202B7237|nr:YceI family protein [Alkalimarinus coralli]